jgi:hypothetical protein
VRSLEEEPNPWKETKCTQLATAVCTTDSSVEENLRPAGGCTLHTSATRCVPEPRQRGDGAEQCSLRQTRKEGTDVGWRLRADLHHDGDPGCARPGCGLMSRYPREASAESPLAATAAGRERREVSCERFGVSSRRSCGPVDPCDRCDPIRVLVAGGQGQPCARWMLARPRRWSGP